MFRELLALANLQGGIVSTYLAIDNDPSRSAQKNIIGGTTAISLGGPCTGTCNLISGNEETASDLMETTEKIRYRVTILVQT